MKFKETEIQGLFEIELFHAKDERGSFTKTFHKSTFDKQGLDSSFDESFFSTNNRGVIRGMHFQNPPYDHSKIVYSASGRIMDVILDIRSASPSYGRYVQIEISSDNHKGIYMPKGVAHGFCCLTEATMIYLTSTEYNAEHESGIKWNSFGFDWPVDSPIISERDQEFVSLSEFKSPFK